MARNKIKLSSGVFFVALLIGANVLLLLPHEQTKKLNYFFVRITAPLLNLIPKSSPADNETVSKFDYNELVRSYENLQMRFQHEREINFRLSGIRQHLPQPGPSIVIANVSKVSIDGQRSEFVINKGSKDGLKKDQYVLSTENGSVIGMISELSTDMSRVKLVTDATQHALVNICREGTVLINCMMNGNNKMQGKIPHIEYGVDIRVNDAVVAGRMPGFLETPLIIGTITKIERDEWTPTLWDITVTPIDNIEALTDVAVVVVDMKTSDDDEDE